jgi:hypothetical protein
MTDPPTSRDPLRAFAFGAVIAAATLAGIVPSMATAAIKTVTIGDTSWSPTSETNRTPLFRGANTIRVVGTNPGIITATGFELRDGVCPDPVGTSGKIVAVGSIKERSARDYAGVSSLILSLPLTQVQSTGNFCGHVYYPPPPVGPLNRDTFTVRIYRRGTVQSITAPTSARGNTEVSITWNGQGIGNATVNPQVTPLPLVLVQRVTSTETQFTANVRFSQCGTHTVQAGHIYDRSAPSALVLDGKYRYQGSASATVKVTENCSSPSPATSQPPVLMKKDPSCGGPGEPPC